jgi:hypothetical protein
VGVDNSNDYTLMFNPWVGFYSSAAAITPHDSTDIAGGPTKAIYVGGAGAVVAVMNGAAVTFAAVPVGTVLRIKATRVNATSTTATNLVALY